MIDAFTVSQSLKYVWLLVLAAIWNKHRNRLANGLFRSVTEKPLGALVPTGDDAV